MESEHHISPWQESCALPPFPKLHGDIQTDVLIIGGGMAGVLCAHLLKEKGVDCALIEARRIGSGVTGNTTAKITSQHGFCYDRFVREFDTETARNYWLANEKAISKYREIASGIDCDFSEKDNIIYTMGSQEILDQEMAALERLRIPADFVYDLPLPIKTTGGIRFEKQGQFHPMKFLAGISEGLPIYEETEAQAFLGNTVVTNRGKITAEKIIVATHFPMLNKHGGYFLKQYQDRSYVIALENAPQVNGMYLDGSDKGYSFRNHGGLLILGGAGHRTGKESGGWAPLEAFANAHYPGARVRYRWAAQDCMSLDGIPYIGQYSSRTSNLYVATGFNKWGMTSSMVSAMILTDLVRGKGNPFAEVFSPSRTILRPQLLINGFESAMNLLTPTKPRCPHLGCALKWNKQEHSWDCPCHGSRFDSDGGLLDGPATGNLKRQPPMA